MRVAEAIGLISREGPCTVCHIAAVEAFHAECYFRALAIKGVCRSCHFRVHRRFLDPEGWRAFLSDCARADDWSTSLLVREISREEAMLLAAQPDIFAALRAW